MGPVRVEVVAHAPTAFYHCQHCEVAWKEAGLGEHIRRDQAATSLPADLAATYHDVSQFARALIRRHGDAVRLQVVDAASIQGFFRSLRYRLRRYPAVIVDGQVLGSDLDAARADIDQRLSRPERAALRAGRR